MAATRFLSREDGDLGKSTIISSRTRVFRDLDASFSVKPSGEIFVKKDAAAVKQAVKNLILTNHFEKPFEPFFGGNIRQLLFELADEDTEEEIVDNISTAIEAYEPRAQIIDIIAESQPDINNLKVTVEFKVVNSNEVVRFSTVLTRLR